MSEVNDLPFPEEDEQINIPLVFKKTDTYTKTGLGEAAKEAMQNIADQGVNDTLEVYTKLKTIQEFVGVCLDEIKGVALDELDKYGKGGTSKFGIPLISKSNGKKYKFDHHEGWCEINDQVVAWTEKQKDLEKKMKNAIGTAGIVDEDTGEVIPPAVVASEGKTTIQATIPKK